jgi:hypothetical protein
LPAESDRPLENSLKCPPWDCEPDPLVKTEGLDVGYGNSRNMPGAGWPVVVVQYSGA